MQSGVLRVRDADGELLYSQQGSTTGRTSPPASSCSRSSRGRRADPTASRRSLSLASSPPAAIGGIRPQMRATRCPCGGRGGEAGVIHALPPPSGSRPPHRRPSRRSPRRHARRCPVRSRSSSPDAWCAGCDLADATLRCAALPRGACSPEVSTRVLGGTSPCSRGCRSTGWPPGCSAPTRRRGRTALVAPLAVAPRAAAHEALAGAPRRAGDRRARADLGLGAMRRRGYRGRRAARRASRRTAPAARSSGGCSGGRSARARRRRSGAQCHR